MSINSVSGSRDVCHDHGFQNRSLQDSIYSTKLLIFFDEGSTLQIDHSIAKKKNIHCEKKKHLQKVGHKLCIADLQYLYTRSFEILKALNSLQNIFYIPIPILSLYDNFYKFRDTSTVYIWIFD